MPPAETATLNLETEETVRVHCDISRDEEMKMRLRCIQIQQETGQRMTRKAYLEKLIRDDVAKVSGASLREVNMRRK